MNGMFRSLCALSISILALGCGGTSDDPPAGEIPTLGEAGSLDEVEPGDVFRVKFETSKGDVVVEVHPEWAPRGAARFRELVEEGFYDGNRFFRVVPDFVIQWGLSGDPVLNRSWQDDRILDDPQVQSNQPGYLTFATSGPHSRTTQLFVNLKDNSFLDSMGFSPFGKVVEGMDVFSEVNDEYGEQPDQGRITNQGNAYLEQRYPNLDYIVKATILEPEEKDEPTTEPSDPEATEPNTSETSDEPENGAETPTESSETEPETEANP